MKNSMGRLAEHPFLRELDQRSLEVISRGAEEVVFEAQEIIARENEPANRFYLIEAGEVALEAHASGRGDVLIQKIGPGDVLGWSWLFAPFLWQFRARASKRTKAICLDGGQVLVSCEENHNFGYELMKRVAQVVVERLQAARRRLMESRPRAWEPVLLSSASRPEGPSELEAAIAEHPFLTGLTATHLKLLASHALQSHFESGAMIFKTGDPANRFYVIQNGRISLEAPSADGGVLIQIIGDGDVLGWSWLYEPYTWHFNARALQPTSAIFFYGTRLRDVCESNHDLGYELMRRITHVVIQRLQAARRQLVEAQPSSVICSDRQ